MQDLSQSLGPRRQQRLLKRSGSTAMTLMLTAATLAGVQNTKIVRAEPLETTPSSTPAASLTSASASLNLLKIEPSEIEPSEIEPSFERSLPHLSPSSLAADPEAKHLIPAPSTNPSPVPSTAPASVEALSSSRPAQAKDLMPLNHSPLTLSQTSEPLEPEAAETGNPESGAADEPDAAPDPDAAPALEENNKPIRPYRYGRRGQKRWFFQTGIGIPYDPAESNTFGLVGAGGTYFFADGHSVNLVLNGLYFSQVGSDAAGINLDLIGRWHIVREKKWSFFVDGGAGIIGTTSRVPLVGGSRFNFTPQVGGGLSFQLPKRKRLLMGVRWYHISNADLYEPNTGLDSVYGWVGVDVPW